MADLRSQLDLAVMQVEYRGMEDESLDLTSAAYDVESEIEDYPEE
jgi:hypothetical protein